EAGSRSDVLEVVLVADASGFPECEDALVDAFGSGFLRVRPYGLAARIRRLRPDLGGIKVRRLFLKRRDSEREGSLDEPGISSTATDRLNLPPVMPTVAVP